MQERERGVGDVTKVQQQAASAASHVARGLDGVFGASRAVQLRKQVQNRREAIARTSGSSSARDDSLASLMPPSATVPRVGLPDAPPPYFERQQVGYARCGLHALNNVLGGELITAADMSQACAAFLAEMSFERPRFAFVSVACNM